MPHVVTFTGITPPARYDDAPWVSARIDEGQAQNGPFSTIDTITLDPQDTDPSQPASRNLTSNNALNANGWYRIVFVDGVGATATGAVLQPDPDGVPAELPEPAATEPVARVVRGRAAKVRAVFTNLDGEPADPTSPKVTITRDDGTALVTDQDATQETAPGIVSTTLTATDLDRLDLLTAVWTGQVGGQAQTVTSEIEVAGGYLFEIADARADAALADADLYSTEDIRRLRPAVEQELERAVGRALVPRYRKDVAALGAPHGRLRTAFPIRVLRRVLMDAAALTSDQFAAVTITNPHTLDSVPTGGKTYQVAYEHGLDAPPPGTTEAALALLKRRLVGTGIDERATSLTTELGTLRFGSTLPQVEAFVNDNRAPLVGILL